MNLRKLVWHKEGYIPERYGWKNYTPTTSVNVLRHDFYHHQPDESGTLEQELRAYGGRYRFEENYTTSSDLVRDVLLFDLNKRLDRESKKFVYNNEPIMEVFFNLAKSTTNHPYYFATFLTAGYNYAQQYSMEAYNKFIRLDFLEPHKCEQNLIVDLDSGDIVSEVHKSVSR